MMMGWVRLLFWLALWVTGFWALRLWNGSSRPSWIAGLGGLGMVALAEGFVWAVRKTGEQKRVGMAFGFLSSLLVASLVAIPLGVLPMEPPVKTFIGASLFLLITFVGLLLGYQYPTWFHPMRILELVKSYHSGKNYKILDTSVIIDGRIADLAETGFIEGTLVVPRFVLRELQYIADSADPIRRNRCRRGLEMLQRMQKKGDIDIAIMEVDFPGVKEVDLKLIELAKQIGAKIITNDYNLNKVAQLHNVKVLNINELATALKPVVLPGETMNVYILKEGKEYNQGVAYLEDGTMVVVDNARKMIGRNIEITVTSVLQTSIGKMIFGKYEGPQPGSS